MKAAPAWARAQLECRRQFRLYTREAIERQHDVPRDVLPDITDDFTFMLTWPAWYLLTGDRAVYDFMLAMRDDWLRTTAADFHHGYFKEGAEAHHHTENYIRFLNKLYQIEPDNPVNRRINTDAAEHFGNFVEGIPEWYDWENHRFLGVQWFGTVTRNLDPKYAYSGLGNMRLMVMVIEAWLMSGDSRFLSLATDHIDTWCELHESTAPGKRLPLRRWFSPEEQQEKELQKLPPTPILPMATCGYLACLMDLYGITRQDHYARTLKRILAEMVGGADVWWLWDGYQKYRAVTFDTSFDADLQKQLEALPQELPTRVVKKGRLPDWGLRWGYADGSLDEVFHPHPSALMATAYAATGDESWAEKAFTQTARRLQLVRPLQDEGRFHGCEWGTINTVLWFDVARAFLPLCGVWGSTNPETGHMLVTARFEAADGGELPETAAVLVRQAGRHEFQVKLANAGRESIEVRVVPWPDYYGRPATWQARAPEKEADHPPADGRLTVPLGPGASVSLSLRRSVPTT